MSLFRYLRYWNVSLKYYYLYYLSIWPVLPNLFIIFRPLSKKFGLFVKNSIFDSISSKYDKNRWNHTSTKICENSRFIFFFKWKKYRKQNILNIRPPIRPFRRKFGQNSPQICTPLLNYAGEESASWEHWIRRTSPWPPLAYGWCPCRAAWWRPALAWWQRSSPPPPRDSPDPAPKRSGRAVKDRSSLLFLFFLWDVSSSWKATNIISKKAPYVYQLVGIGR